MSIQHDLIDVAVARYGKDALRRIARVLARRPDLRARLDGFPVSLSQEEPEDPYRALAMFYADIWNLGIVPDESEIETVGGELADGEWVLYHDGERWQIKHGSEGNVELAAARAPKGGVTLGGKFYRGGQWIPSQELDKADPETRARIEGEAKAHHDKRRSRGDVDTGKLRKRLEPHKQELSPKEQRNLRLSYAGLKRHHGELVVHRLEELADQLGKAYEKATDPAQKEEIGKRLRGVNDMLDMAEKDGHKGEVKGEEVKKATPAAPEQEAPKADEAKPSLASLPDKELAEKVLAAADAQEYGFGNNKVYISDVYDTLKKEDPSLTLEDFKKRLVDLSQAGLISWGRADLPIHHRKEDLDRSELKYLTGTFHYIHPREERWRKSRKDENPEATQPVSVDKNSRKYRVQNGLAGQHELTQEEYLARAAGGKGNIEYLSQRQKEAFLGEHRKKIKEAMDAGESVPPEVLKDYPDLSGEKAPEEKKPSVKEMADTEQATVQQKADEQVPHQEVARKMAMLARMEGGITTMAGAYVQMKRLVPGLTPEKFQDFMRQAWEKGALQLNTLNEVRNQSEMDREANLVVKRKDRSGQDDDVTYGYYSGVDQDKLEAFARDYFQPKPSPKPESSRKSKESVSAHLAKSTIPENLRKEYESHAHSVLDNMPPKAHERFSANLKDSEFYPDNKSMQEELSKRSPKVRKLLESGKVAGGAWEKKAGKLHLDGGTKSQTAREVYAHEMTHTIDGPDHEISGSNEWKEAFAKEGKDISAYGASSPHEAFAEFGRLVYANQVSSEELKKKYPLATAVWEKNGLLPEGNKSPMKALPEVFEGEPIEEGGTHIDPAKKPPVDWSRIDALRKGKWAPEETPDDEPPEKPKPAAPVEAHTVPFGEWEKNLHESGDWKKYSKRKLPLGAVGLRIAHREEVASALKKGKDVPVEVLRAYPDLVKKYRDKLEAKGVSLAMEEPEETALDLIVERAAGAGFVVADAVKEEIRAAAKKAKTAEEFLEAVKDILSTYQPYMVQILSDSMLAARLTAASAIVERITPEAPPITPNPPERFELPEPEDEPVIRYPIIEEAAQSMSRRKVLTQDEYRALDGQAKSQAFNVAGVQSESALTAIRDELAESAEQGKTFKEFVERADEVTDGLLGPFQLETVFRTNIAQQFKEGQKAVLENEYVKSGFPFLMKEGIDDGRQRPHHLWFQKNGLDETNVFWADDPVIRQKGWYFPVEFNCRCLMIPLSVEDAAARGVKAAQEWLATGVMPEKKYVTPPDFELDPHWR